MSRHRAIQLTTATALFLFSQGCGSSAMPTGSDDAGTIGGEGGNGGTTGEGGANPGGASGSAGIPGSGGVSGGGGMAGNTGPGGFGGFGGILDAGLGALADAISACPANPQGMACGGGGPVVCIGSGGSMAPAGCICRQQVWSCPDLSGLRDAGLSADARPRPACAANVANTTCPMVGAVCSSGDAGTDLCACIPGAMGAATWRCTPPRP